jgi:nicotinamidase-related amidase
MAEPLVLDPKRCALIVIDMVNAIAKGGAAPY